METFTSHGLVYTQAISKALEDRVPWGGGGGGCLVVEVFTSHEPMYTQAISKALEDRVPEDEKEQVTT